jgi:hypothetical protein
MFKVSESQKRHTFDQLQLAHNEMETVRQIKEVARDHEGAAKRILEASGIAGGMPLMIPGKPLAMFFGGLCDGDEENIDPKWIRDGHVSRMRDGGIETYEPAVIMQTGSEIITALMVRAGHALNFRKRILSPAFSSEMAVMIRYLVISLGSTHIAQLMGTLDFYRRSAVNKPEATTCVIQIAKA